MDVVAALAGDEYPRFQLKPAWYDELQPYSESIRIMKNKIRIALALFSFVMVPSALAQNEQCEAKRSALEKEIAYAREHGNTNRVSGLETALSKLTANCTDASLDAKKERRIRAAQEKVDHRERDLEKAKAEGKSQAKIAQRQRKVDEAHEELQRAQAEAAK